MMPRRPYRRPAEVAEAASGDSSPKTESASRRPGLSLKGRALAYLARREHSRLELRRKLAPHAGTQEELDALLDLLERENLLSNQRFAESVVNRRASRLGTSRILSELKQHALDPQAVSDVAERLRGTEFERAHAVWQKKFGQPADSPQERARQMRFLAGRGFSQDVIRKVVRGADFDD